MRKSKYIVRCGENGRHELIIEAVSEKTAKIAAARVWLDEPGSEFFAEYEKNEVEATKIERG